MGPELIPDLLAFVEEAKASRDFAPARAAILSAITANPTDPANWMALIRLQEAMGDYVGVLDSLEKIDRFSPGNAGVLLRLSMVKGFLGDAPGAETVLRRARAALPRNAEIAARLANFSRDGERESALADLREFARLTADEPRLAAQAFETLVQLQNREARIREGKTPGFAVSWQDAHGWSDLPGLLEFRDMLTRELSLPRVDFTAVLQFAEVALVQREWDTAEAYFERVRLLRRNAVTDVISFNPQLWKGFASQPMTETLAGLPPVETVVEPASRLSAPYSLLLASDPGYFTDFTLPLLDSLKRHAPDLQVHIHLLDGVREEWIKLARQGVEAFGSEITLTAERSGARERGGPYAKFYYHAIRFVRFYEFLARRDRAYWMMDVDAECHADPTPLLSRIVETEIALWFRSGTLEPWNKVQAGIVGGSVSEASIGFFRAVAAFIATTWRESGLQWWIDQVALYAASVHMFRNESLPSAIFLDDALVSHGSPSPTAALHFASGAKKHTQLNRSGG